MSKNLIFLKMHRFLTQIFDLILLNFLIIILSIPIFTIGINLTSAYYVLIKRERQTDSYLLKDFFHAFKENFVQVTFIWISIFTLFVISVLLFINGGVSNIIFNILAILIAIVALFIFIYVFPILSNYYFSIREVLATSLYISIKNWKQTMLLIIVNLAPILLCIKYPHIFLTVGITTSLFLGFSITLLINTKILVPIFNRMIEEKTATELF